MRRKLQRFLDNASQDNLLEPGKPAFESVRGNWNRNIFRNDHPLVVELGCGSGELAVALAESSPNRNVIGVDKRGARMWVGNSCATTRGLVNVAFLRADIAELDRYFGPGEIGEIWITFPDPRPRHRDARRRLTSPRFLNTYRRLLRSDGWVRFKTDDADLFDYTLALLGNGIGARGLAYTTDLYRSPLLTDQSAWQTRYEKRFLERGASIKYLEFQFHGGRPARYTTARP
ncbi:MAG: tRNA (guanosine(46)-N7)-methyltransferase TrmB [Vicinamibacterales bacterium]|nr:tRNA (guanosine(46)-N7)-methyltransferase TrmB [Vicinamibacterales bacterium]MDP7480010.1 tRNA (guanosine(46)-N7)-methyltransferase TrmB [Vicinamibacterales bacterium]HJN43523.1 tRNA (guanosine(46)-N7)-methyltransferase TrmB [Vicinamibacterales bacterium]